MLLDGLTVLDAIIFVALYVLSLLFSWLIIGNWVFSHRLRKFASSQNPKDQEAIFSLLDKLTVWAVQPRFRTGRKLKEQDAEGNWHETGQDEVVNFLSLAGGKLAEFIHMRMLSAKGALGREMKAVEKQILAEGLASKLGDKAALLAESPEILKLQKKHPILFQYLQENVLPKLSKGNTETNISSGGNTGL